MLYSVTHRTFYQYDSPVDASYGQIHQLPMDRNGQRCLKSQISISPTPEQVHYRSDFFENQVAFYSIHTQHSELDVVCASVVETNDQTRNFDSPLASSGPWSRFVDHLTSESMSKNSDILQFVLDSPRVKPGANLADFGRESFTPTATLLEALHDLNHRIYSEFRFSPEATDVSTPIEEVLDKRAGVCQDFAHLMLGTLRSLKIPARYVSGYLETVPPPGQEKLAGADQSHAWVEVYVGERGWAGFDPTNDQLANHRYVTTAHGRDYDDITPLRGIVFTDATETEMTVEVDVLPLDAKH